MRKILFCAVDVGGRIGQYSKLLHDKFGSEVACQSFVKYAVSLEHYQTEYTKVYQFHEKSKLTQWWLSFRYFLWALFRFNVIYIISAENILTHKLLGFELWAYRLFGKKVVMHFVGSDIRNTQYLIWRNNHASGSSDEQSPPKQTPKQVKRCALAEKYAAKILVSTPDLLQFFGSNKVQYLPVFLDLASGYERDDSREGVSVLFAPSHAEIKGADVISPVLSNLQDVNVVDTTKMVPRDKKDSQYKLTRYELLELYSKSNVLVDQVIIGWYGLQALEALAHGLLPVVRIDKDLESYLPEDCPMVTFSDIESLKEKLAQAVAMVSHGTWNSTDGVNWVNRFHRPDSNTSLNEILEWMAKG